MKEPACNSCGASAASASGIAMSWAIMGAIFGASLGAFFYGFVPVQSGGVLVSSGLVGIAGATLAGGLGLLKHRYLPKCQKCRTGSRGFIWVSSRLLAGFVALQAVLLHTVAAPQSVATTDGDKELVFTVEDLAPYLNGHVPRPSNAVLEKSLYPDGAIDVTYRYSDEHLSLESLSILAPSAKNAANYYAAALTIMKVTGSSWQDGTTSPTWGDHSAYQVNEGRTSHSFVVQHGRFVVSFLLAGHVFSDHQEFAQFVQPVLERLDTFPR